MFGTKIKVVLRDKRFQVLDNTPTYHSHWIDEEWSAVVNTCVLQPLQMCPERYRQLMWKLVSLTLNCLFSCHGTPFLVLLAVLLGLIAQWPG